MTDERAAPPTGARLDLLRRLGFDTLEHDSHVPFLSHLLGTRRLLVEWGERPALCDAGLFHSAYGTEYFPHTTAVDRAEVQTVIGTEAEQVVWWWCNVRRDTFSTSSESGATATVVDRTSGDLVTLDARGVTDLATLWAADTVEQLARMAPDERDFARNLHTVLWCASPAAQAAARVVLPLLDQP